MTGRYTITIKYGGDEIPYSPFRIHALPTGDASKCLVTGGFHLLPCPLCLISQITQSLFLWSSVNWRTRTRWVKHLHPLCLDHINACFWQTLWWFLMFDLRIWHRPHHPDWGGNGHNCGRKGCWERKSDLQSHNSWWGGAGCGCGWEHRWNIRRLLHCSRTWQIRHHNSVWRRKHPQQSISCGGGLAKPIPTVAYVCVDAIWHGEDFFKKTLSFKFDYLAQQTCEIVILKTSSRIYQVKIQTGSTPSLTNQLILLMILSSLWQNVVYLAEYTYQKH